MKTRMLVLIVECDDEPGEVCGNLCRIFDETKPLVVVDIDSPEPFVTGYLVHERAEIDEGDLLNLIEKRIHLGN